MSNVLQTLFGASIISLAVLSANEIENPINVVFMVLVYIFVTIFVLIGSKFFEGFFIKRSLDKIQAFANKAIDNVSERISIKNSPIELIYSYGFLDIFDKTNDKLIESLPLPSVELCKKQPYLLKTESLNELTHTLLTVIENYKGEEKLEDSQAD